MKKYVFDVKPVGKPRMTQSDKWRKRKCVIAYFDYKDEIRRQAEEQGFELENGMKFYFYIPIYESWSAKRKKENLNQLCLQKPDLDNLLKAFWDACTNKDEAIAYIKEAKKFWSDSPRIEVIK